MKNLTPKQEHFTLAYVETGNASEAYRQAYNAEEMKPETVHRKASELLADGKITARIAELQADHQARHNITVDDLLDELEEARQMAKDNGNSSAMVTATMGKAKLLGLDKQIIDLQTETVPLPTAINVIFSNERYDEQEATQ